MEGYVSPRPWTSERSDALVVCCSDGRYHPHFLDYVRERVGEKPDMYAVPGGPATIDPWSSYFDHAHVFDDALSLMLSTHVVRSIWLIAHHQCGFYRRRWPGLTDDAIRERQLQDLDRASRRISERCPSLAVHAVYAHLQGDAVRFEELTRRALGARAHRA